MKWSQETQYELYPGCAEVVRTTVSDDDPLVTTTRLETRDLGPFQGRRPDNRLALIEQLQGRYIPINGGYYQVKAGVVTYPKWTLDLNSPVTMITTDLSRVYSAAELADLLAWSKNTIQFAEWYNDQLIALAEVAGL